MTFSNSSIFLLYLMIRFACDFLYPVHFHVFHEHISMEEFSMLLLLIGIGAYEGAGNSKVAMNSTNLAIY